jgi:hypothetical protein
MAESMGFLIAIDFDTIENCKTKFSDFSYQAQTVLTGMQTKMNDINNSCSADDFPLKQYVKNFDEYINQTNILIDNSLNILIQQKIYIDSLPSETNIFNLKEKINICKDNILENMNQVETYIEQLKIELPKAFLIYKNNIMKQIVN